jgi:hypothetical protein
VLALFIFTDVSYIACCNSFYTDVATWLFLSWAVELWLYFIRDRHPSTFSMFIGAVLCALSKAQHAALGLFLCVLAAIAALSFRGRWRKAGALVLAGLILAAAARSFRLMPEEEKGDDAYAGIFVILLEKSPTPLRDLRDLGLGTEYAPLDRPLPHARCDRSGESRLVERFQPSLRSRTDCSLPVTASLARSGNRLPSAAQTCLSSAAELGQLRAAVRFSTQGSNEIIRMVELGVSSTADAGEIPRHLFLVHVITDFTIVLAIVWAAWNFQGRASLRANS